MCRSCLYPLRTKRQAVEQRRQCGRCTRLCTCAPQRQGCMGSRVGIPVRLSDRIPCPSASGTLLGRGRRSCGGGRARPLCGGTTAVGELTRAAVPSPLGWPLLEDAEGLARSLPSLGLQLCGVSTTQHAPTQTRATAMWRMYRQWGSSKGGGECYPAAP
jgi:hypothetical protein